MKRHVLYTCDEGEGWQNIETRYSIDDSNRYEFVEKDACVVHMCFTYVFYLNVF